MCRLLRLGLLEDILLCFSTSY